MLKLVEDNEEQEEIISLQKEQENEKRKARIRYLEIAIEQEQEEISLLKKRLEKGKEEMLISLICIGISIGMLIYLGLNAIPFVVSVLKSPLVAILVIGIMVKFIAHTVNLAKKHIPMYIWCEMERKGKEVKYDNFERQYQKHIRDCEIMETERKALLMQEG